MLIFSLGVSAKPLKIGLIYPLKGPQSNTMCISEAIINDLNDKNITVLKLDTKNSIEGTLQAAQKAIEEKVDLVIGTRLSQESLAIAELFESHKIAFIAPFSSHPDITNNKAYIMRMVPTSESYSKILAKNIVFKESPKRLAIVTNLSLPYSQDHSKRLIENIKKLDTKVEFINFEIIDGFSNYANLAEDIKKSNVDILYLPLYIQQVTNILSELKIINNHLKIFIHGAGPLISGKKFNPTLQYINEISFNSPQLSITLHTVWDCEIEGKLKNHYLKLMKEYCAPFKNELGTAIAYDTLMFLLNNYQLSPDLKGTDLISTLKRSEFNGVSGRISFDTTGEPIRKLSFFNISNGTINIETLYDD